MASKFSLSFSASFCIGQIWSHWGLQFDTCVSKPLSIGRVHTRHLTQSDSKSLFCLATVQRSYDPWWSLTLELCSWLQSCFVHFPQWQIQIWEAARTDLPMAYSLGFEVLFTCPLSDVAEFTNAHSAEHERSMFWCRASLATNDFLFSQTPAELCWRGVGHTTSPAVYSRLEDRRAADRPLKMLKWKKKWWKFKKQTKNKKCTTKNDADTLEFSHCQKSSRELLHLDLPWGLWFTWMTCKYLF